MKILLANFTKMVGDSGGMARVNCHMANEFVKRGHEVSLIYSDERVGDFYYPIDQSVACYDLQHFDGGNIKFPLRLKIKREWLRLFDKQKARTVGIDFQNTHLSANCKKILKKINPNIIISYNPGTSSLLLCVLQTKIPVITMSHGDPADYFRVYPKISVEAVGKSAVNQVLLPSYVKAITDHFPQAETVAIGNAIPQFSYSADLAAQKEQHKIIFVGRLAKGHKRPHLLIKAFSQVAAKYPHWIVELWGAKDRAAYYKELEHLIKTAHLEDRIFLKGSTNQVPEKLREADIFAFPSAFEGFGMALAEGMSVGLPAVGYKNCPAVNELIKDGVNGLLCDDGVEPFAKALDTLMGNQNLRVQMGQAARADMAQYAPQQIWDQWEELIERVVAK